MNGDNRPFRPPIPAEQARIEADLRRHLAAAGSPVDEDDIRDRHPGMHVVEQWIDPGFHPSRSRYDVEDAMYALSMRIQGDLPVGIGALWQAARYAVAPDGAAAGVLSEGAIESWLRCGRRFGADPRDLETLAIPSPAPAPGSPADWMFAESRFAAAMLLAVGAPARLVPFENGPKRDLVVSREYADAFLGPWDVRRRRAGMPPHELIPWGVGAALRTARHILGHDADGRRQLDGLILAIAESVRAVPRMGPLGQIIGIRAAVDLAPFYITCDWIEERADAGIATNLRQLGSWLAALDKIEAEKEKP